MDRLLRDQLVSFLTTAQAHMTYQDAVKDFPLDRINEFPPQGQYTPYMLLEHIRLTQKDIIDFMLDPDYKEPKWPDEYWPGKDTKADEKMWKDSLKGFEDDLHRLVTYIQDPKTDLSSKVENGDGQTVLREVFLVIDHNSNELGEFAILRQVMATWPKDRKE